jgi:phenylpropionate dioxygenase-like ring-hydroxylating dioxygenase large terminal subunit
MQPVVNQVSELLDSIDKGVSLPASWYTDPNVLDKEIEKIFRRTWQYVGSTHELKNVGDFLTAYVGNVPVVAVRNKNGIEAFVNVCRHRRHEVMNGCGNSKVMQCKYHAWTYDLEGCLKSAPRSDREQDFNIDDYPLISLRAETLGPFVFVNFDEKANPVQSYFGKMLDIIRESGIDLGSLEIYSRDDWESQSNWKTMIENYLECYHCPIAHPGFSAAIDVDQDSYQLTAYDWFSTQLGFVNQSALEGNSKVKIYDAKGAIVQAQYHLAWPNLTISINPGFPNLSVDVWNPNGPNRSKGIFSQFFGAGVDESWAKELVEFNRQVGHEDDELTNSVQRGLIGGIPDKGRFLTNSEHLIIHFQKLIVKAIAEE